MRLNQIGGVCRRKFYDANELVIMASAKPRNVLCGMVSGCAKVGEKSSTDDSLMFAHKATL